MLMSVDTVRTRLILFPNTFCRFACEMFHMNAVIAVFNSLSVRGRSRHTADFAAPHRSKCTVTLETIKTLFKKHEEAEQILQMLCMAIIM
jgi:hypothetical protein